MGGMLTPGRLTSAADLLSKPQRDAQLLDEEINSDTASSISW